ncbi:MAG: rhomboid family intramembrane serine protease [Pleurocapsa sp. SU_196_0]|nr:rhomboid family intramembrane serine protease [Pleurocapsa sp. SU_196_0]
MEPRWSTRGNRGGAGSADDVHGHGHLRVLLSATFGPSNVVSIGASGAIFGLLGFLVTNGTHNLQQVSSQLRRNASNLILMLGIGLLIPGIDNWGHAGGLLSGLVLGYAYRRPSRGTRTTLALASAAVLAFGAYTIVSRA